jgi:hypothetical protein
MLTATQARMAIPLLHTRKLSDSGGLYLLVVPMGGKYWRYNYRFDRRYRTIALGTYPEVSLAKARARHQDAKRQLADGVDPSARKRADILAWKRFPNHVP